MANPAAQTAVGPMVIVAVEQYAAPDQRIIDDPLAYQLLPRSTQPIVRLARWRPMQRLLFRVTEQTARGIWGCMLCRKRAIDDALCAALPTLSAVVNLGAGLDTRAVRLSGLAHLPVWELDLPANIAAKERSIRALSVQRPPALRLVPIEFEQQAVGAVLTQHGYDHAQVTFFIWEGVTQYLTEAAVRQTFDVLAQAAPGSRLAFTYVRQDFLDGSNLYDAVPTYQRFRAKQQIWKFGWAPSDVAAFIAAYGWHVVDHLGSQEFMSRYVVPNRRQLPVSELERLVIAEKR